MQTKILISVIIPICVNDKWTAHVAERVESVVAACIKSGWEVMVVDASRRFSTNISIIIEQLNARYIHCPQEGTFSAGRARDIGAQYAKGQFLFFFDVDLVFMQQTAIEINQAVECLREKPYSFLMIPCLYLTKTATKVIDADIQAIKTIWHSYLSGDYSGTVNLAIASSAIVIDRMTYLTMGGHRPEFYGHGCEDLELINRLTSEFPMGLRELDYLVDERQDVVAQSVGFRRHFTYYGIPIALQGIILAHRWHPRPITESYFRSRSRNNELFQRFLQENENNGDCPSALPDRNITGRTLILLGEEFTDIQILRQFLPRLGDYHVAKNSTVEEELEGNFLRILYVGSNARQQANQWRKSDSRVWGSLSSKVGNGSCWRLTLWKAEEVLVDEQHEGVQHFYGDGKSFRWVFFSGKDCLTGNMLYEFTPPDYKNLSKLPPLDEYIRKQMIIFGYDPEVQLGLFKSQWQQKSTLERWQRLLRKLVLNPRGYFHDSRYFKYLWTYWRK